MSGRVFAGVAFALALAAVPTTSASDDRWETLQAIHLVENPKNSTKVGRKGELGPYQFRPGTWRMHTKKPFYLAANRAEADRVAVKHYQWISRQLERNGLPVTPYHVGLAWNAGVTAAINDTAPASSHQYAERVQALAEDMKRRQLARD